MKKYRTIKGIEKDIRKGILFDIISFKGLVYTMENYDGDGKTLNYKNKVTTNAIYVNTFDRYESFEDAVVTFEENEGCYRNDIHYYEEVEE